MDIAPAFVGKLVRLRAYEPADHAPLNDQFNDPEVLAGVGVPWPQSVAGFRQFVDGLRSETDQEGYVIESLEGRSPIGGCGLMHIHAPTRSAELGIWLARSSWDRGYGTDATRTLCRFAFRHMNLHRIELNVFATNPRALRAYEKVGFRTEGTRRDGTFQSGSFVSSSVMSLLDDELIEE